MEYCILRIDEDLDYGCEEPEEGTPVMAIVTLADAVGNTRIIRVPDRSLYEQNLSINDFAVIDENGCLIRK